MKSKQYFIATRNGKIEVKGYPVVIPDFEQFSFFVHHAYLIQYGGINHGMDYFSKDWSISEEITGGNCMPSSWGGGMTGKTRAGALAILVKRFKSTGHELIKERLKREIERAQGGKENENHKGAYCKSR